MDKKLKRQIGYVRSSASVTLDKPSVSDTVKDAEVNLSEVPDLIKLKSLKIARWINERKEFKWGGMCKVLGIDKGNFYRILKSESPDIKIEHIVKIEQFLIKYGYA